MIVADLMTKVVTHVGMDKSLKDINDLFHQSKFHHLLVVENLKLVGVISDRDVLKAISPFVGSVEERSQDLHTLQKKAHQIMTHHPITTKRDTPLADAVALMEKNKISCLPVISDDGRIEGILTYRDIVRWTVKQFANKTIP